MAGKRLLADRQCAACGQGFRPARSSARFCSRPCARTINGGHNRKDETWWVCSKGYLVGRVWRDGKRVNVRKHRLIMEQALGRPLLAHEDVHHKDGDKLNNELSNLEVLTRGEHSALTNASRTYRRGYRLKLSDAERLARSERLRALHIAGKVHPPARAALRKVEAQ